MNPPVPVISYQLSVKEFTDQTYIFPITYHEFKQITQINTD